MHKNLIIAIALTFGALAAQAAPTAPTPASAPIAAKPMTPPPGQPGQPDPATFAQRKDAILSMITQMEQRLPKDKACISEAKNDQDLQACRERSRPAQPSAAKPAPAPASAIAPAAKTK